jgi:hypothetical protein
MLFAVSPSWLFPFAAKRARRRARFCAFAGVTITMALLSIKRSLVGSIQQHVARRRRATLLVRQEPVLPCLNRTIN